MAWQTEGGFTVSTTAVELIPDVIANPRYARVHIHSTGDYYLGNTSSVTASTGLKITARHFEIDVASGDDLYAITASGSVHLEVDFQAAPA